VSRLWGWISVANVPAGRASNAALVGAKTVNGPSPDSVVSRPAVVTAVSHRLRRGRTVVAFPEGTTFCGPHHGRFRPAVFQAAVDVGRPVQPLRLVYRDAGGRARTLTALLGEDSLWASLKRTLLARGTVVDVAVGALQLPGADRRELAARCEAVVRAL
jgi:1-acyl-sn-glycerol-3-phosphate acyltransferase